MSLFLSAASRRLIDDCLHTAGLRHMKEASSSSAPQSACALSGRLYLSKSGWILLSVPNAVVRGLFDALDERGCELPLKESTGALEAHISVMRPEEIAKIEGGADAISERGHGFRYQLGAVKRVRPRNWGGVSCVWFVEVKSKELEQLRSSYGLSALPKKGKHQFHITFAIRRTGALRESSTQP